MRSQEKRMLAVGLVTGLGLGALALAGCESEESSVVLTAGGTGTGTPTAAGGIAGEGGTGTFDPEPDPCTGHAGDLICLGSVAVTCDAEGKQASEEDCAPEICVPGSGCTLCVEGQYQCEGNAIVQCDVGPPLQWTSVTTCDPVAGQRCNATTGACEALQPIGNGPSAPTGTYYQYAIFDQNNSPFTSGYDVDSLGNYIYVNSWNWTTTFTQTLDVYSVELLDSDGDGEFEPNQHPDNPDDQGPIEERVLTKVTTYNVTLGGPSSAELYAVSDRVYFVNNSSGTPNVFEYVFGASSSATAVTATGNLRFSQMGYDEVNGVWYGSQEIPRRVYSYHEPSQSWVAEFDFPDLAGSHMDGLEVVVDPNSGIVYVYVSDMTSDFIGQYVRDRGGSWRQVNLFEYDQPEGALVEGMGFGALNHFWATGGTYLYELGGGDLQKYTEPYKPPR